jgi:hypothetical protein
MRRHRQTSINFVFAGGEPSISRATAQMRLRARSVLLDFTSLACGARGLSMTATLIAQILKVGLSAWLVLLTAIVIGRILRGNISCRGMLADDPQRAGSETAPMRVVAALVFPLVIMFLILQALNFDVSAVEPGTRPSFPDIPDNLVLLLTGGNGLYLASKASFRGT